MASNATQIEIDGPRNVVTKTTGDDTAPTPALPAFTIIQDPTNGSLSDMNPGMSGLHPATRLRIDCIQYSISDGIAIQLYWNSTTPILITELSGRGKIEAKWFGGLQNNAGVGVTGAISFSVIVIDALAAGTVTWTLMLQTVKYRPISVGGA